MDALVVLEVTMRGQPLLLRRRPHLVAHVCDEVIDKEVRSWMNLRELLRNAIEASKLVFDLDRAIAGLNAGFMYHRKRLGSRVGGEPELGAQSIATDRLAGYRFLEEKAKLLDEAQRTR